MSRDSHPTVPNGDLQHSIDNAHFSQSLAVSAASGFLHALAAEHHDSPPVDPSMSTDVHHTQDPQASSIGHEHDPSGPQEHGAPWHVDPVPDLHHH